MKLGFLLSTLLITQVFASPAQRVSFRVRFGGSEFSVHADAKSLFYEDRFGQHTLDVRTCNRQLVIDFIRDYEHGRKTDLGLPASMLQRNALILKDGNQEEALNAGGKFGLWLRGVPSRLSILFIAAQAECDPKR